MFVSGILKCMNIDINDKDLVDVNIATSNYFLHFQAVYWPPSVLPLFWYEVFSIIAKVRLKLKKVGKTTRPFRYDLNQIPYDYTVEVRNRFKGLDLIDRVPDEL